MCRVAQFLPLSKIQSKGFCPDQGLFPPEDRQELLPAKGTLFGCGLKGIQNVLRQARWQRFEPRDQIAEPPNPLKQESAVALCLNADTCDFEQLFGSEVQNRIRYVFKRNSCPQQFFYTCDVITLLLSGHLRFLRHLSGRTKFKPTAIARLDLFLCGVSARSF